jgi:D-aspartate ligase
MKHSGLISDSTTPAVVLVCHHHVGIGIVRSLGRLGVPVYCVDVDRFNPACLSKYCAGKFVWDLHNSPRSESVDFLLDIGRKIGRRALLIPTSDIGAMLVDDNAERLSSSFIFPQRPGALTRSLCSKQEMFYLARKWGLPVPETAFPKSRADVVRYLETARLPVLLKPIYNLHPSGNVKPWRMMLVDTREELLSRYDTIENPAAPNVMLQEYIPGPDEMTWTFNGYFDQHGECRVAFTGRKLRNFPPYFGQASLAACEKNEYVRDATIGFMKSIGYRGPLDIGHRYDMRDGKYKVNDINPRVGAMFRLFVDENGMDVVRALYQDLTGQPVTPASTVEGRRWVVEDVDLVSSVRYYRDRKFSLRGWINSYRGVREATFLARDDLLPLAGMGIVGARLARKALFGDARARAIISSAASASPNRSVEVRDSPFSPQR